MSSAPLPSPRVSIHTCQGLFDKLKWEFEQLEKQGWDEYRIFNFVVTAWHLYYDWINNAGTDAQKGRRDIILVQKKKYGAHMIFAALRDLTNASKHWTLKSNPDSPQVVTNVSDPQITNYYDYYFAGPVVNVNVDGFNLSITEVARLAIGCMEWILNGDCPFPDDLKRELQYVFESKWTK
jgi:hypothetical protein